MITARVHDQMIAAGPKDLDPLGREQPAVIGVLVADCKDGLANVATVNRGKRLTKRGLSNLTPRMRWFDLRFDDFGDECDGVRVQPVNRLALERLATKQ